MLPPQCYLDLLLHMRRRLQDPRCGPVDGLKELKTDLAVATQQVMGDTALRWDRIVDQSLSEVPLLNQVNRSGLDGDSSRGDPGLNWAKVIDYDSVTAQRPGFLFQWLRGSTKI
jgi:hypothetical protein